MCEGYNVRQLRHQSGHSERTLWRIIHHWLEEHEPPPLGDLSAHRYLVIDTTYLCRRGAPVTVVMDAHSNHVIAGVLGIHEGSRGMAVFCRWLAQCGLRPTAITTDGNPQLLHYLRAQWPAVTLQRCLVHIQRQGLSWCRRRPQCTDAQRLRDLYQQLSTVRTRQDRDQWIDQFIDWEIEHGWMIGLSPERGRVFSDLKRARSLCVGALPNMFHHLDNPNIVSHTNGLEGYFSRLKLRYRQHRGLSPAVRANYVSWYLHLCPK
jgi:hypothetical protein